MQKGADGFSIPPPTPPNSKYLTYTEHVNGLHVRLVGYRQTMAEIATSLAQRLGGTVTDTTRLTGEYDYTLTYSKEDSPPADSWPDIFDAVRSQLGLRLERTGSVPADASYIVIDSMARQSAAN